MNRLLIFGFAIFMSGNQVCSQVKLQTTAEKSDFKSTSNYNDVMTFISQLKKTSRYIRTETIARSSEGMDVPLLIIGNPLPESPQQLINDKRIVVYIQANIHAGEVEGKEAALMFARDLLSEKNPGLLQHVVLLVCPLFNPDGNEKISQLNRPYQNGPVNGVGVRHNEQYLDLNRDGMKTESPEVRGVITRIFNTWDPAVFMDCHTTDGSYHVEPVTFTWMVNPNGNNDLINYMRNRMIPEMSATLINKYKIENCYYGEFNNMMQPENGWFYDAADPRYMSNYYGLRNRLGILNENYVYADFKTRVFGCYYLIQSLLDYASANKSEIKKMLQEVDAETVNRGLNPAVSDSFGIEFKVRPLPEKVTIKTYEADLVTDANGRRSVKRSDRQKTVTIPYFIDYYASKNVKFPFAYLITVKDQEVLELLKRHGIKIEKLTLSLKIPVEKFEISELKGSARLNQGHYTNVVKGRFLKDTIDFPVGTVVIRTAQPMANLASYLLEPQSNDGLMTWNFFDRYLVPQWGLGYYLYPVYKVIAKIEIKTIPLL
ncbi:MAG: M14 family metallopeptidase [Bacteroidales bacterium]|nr:M14 family metallopeptidase [Bacteroidales bacterium]